MNYEEEAARYLRQSGRGIITYEEYCEKMKALYRHAYDRGYITREVCGHPVQYHGCLACYEEAL